MAEDSERSSAGGGRTHYLQPAGSQTGAEADAASVTTVPEDHSADPPAPDAGVLPKATPYDPEPRREQLRGWIAGTLIFLLILIVVAAFVSLWIGPVPADDLRAILALIFPTVAALVSGVIGYYYGSSRDRS